MFRPNIQEASFEVRAIELWKQAILKEARVSLHTRNPYQKPFGRGTLSYHFGLFPCAMIS